VEVTTLDDLWEGEVLPLTVNGVDVIVLNLGGDIVAYADKCPHLETPLSTGVIEDGKIMCSAHQWTFDASNGAGINPLSACLRRFAVKVDDEETVFVNVNDVIQESKGML
jgi:toluene monooxygenase system ferredoxin subunit